MDRFSPYFLGNILQLEDHFCRYYVQDVHRSQEESLDVPHMWFFDEEMAEQWLEQCVEYESCDTMRALRDFLWYHGTEGWQLHRMYDDAVLRAAALELVLHSLTVVIRPGFGAVVESGSDLLGCGYPFSLSSEPDSDARFTRMARHLNALVNHQKRRQATAPGQIATALDAYPGFHSGLIRQLPDLGGSPQRLAAIRYTARLQNRPSPVAQQIDTVAAALHLDREMRLACRTMLTISVNDPEVMTLIHEFAADHLAATGEQERRQLGIATTEDMATAFILAVAVLCSNHGAAVAGQVAILAKAAEQLHRLAKDLKSIEPRDWRSAKSRQAETERARQQPTPQRTPPPDPFQQDDRAEAAPLSPAAEEQNASQQTPREHTAAAQEPPPPHDLMMELYASEEEGEEPLNITDAGHLLVGPEQLQEKTTPERLDQVDISPGNYKFAQEARKVENRQLKS
ncbi:MAG: hypothetical protein KFF50_14170 [Desulfatitalea sp.]|nr:hypothetical protein [Desulfatitalea sp.]